MIFVKGQIKSESPKVFVPLYWSCCRVDANAVT